MLFFFLPTAGLSASVTFSFAPQQRIIKTSRVKLGTSNVRAAHPPYNTQLLYFCTCSRISSRTCVAFTRSSSSSVRCRCIRCSLFLNFFSSSAKHQTVRMSIPLIV